MSADGGICYTVDRGSAFTETRLCVANLHFSIFGSICLFPAPREFQQQSTCALFFNKLHTCLSLDTDNQKYSMDTKTKLQKIIPNSIVHSILGQSISCQQTEDLLHGSGSAFTEMRLCIASLHFSVFGSICLFPAAPREFRQQSTCAIFLFF